MRITPATSHEDASAEGGWYALKVFHNKVFAVEADLQGRIEVECYVPLERIMVTTPSGKMVAKTRPAIAGLMFIRCDESQLKAIRQQLSGQAMFYTAADGTPALISQREMTMFRLVTSSGESGLEYLSDDVANYAIGQRVRVLEGPFKGAEGCIRRIRGNRRLVVSINGICAVATSYIPTCFLEKI